MNTPDVHVVGGGVIGCSVAYYLARAGASVTLFERDDIAGHASGAAAGMLAPISESSGEGAFFDLGARSLGMFPDLVRELRELSLVDPQYVPSGLLRVAHSPQDAEHLRRQAERLPRYGLRWLSPEQAREQEPHLPSHLHGALWSPEEGHVYSPLLTRAYAQAAVHLGARVERGMPVLGLLRTGTRVEGVRTAAGDRSSGQVVLCAGPWTRFCADWLRVPLPIEPVLGQILALGPPVPPLRSILWGEGAYLVPKLNGQIIVGATEERAGFDCRTTAAGLGGLLQAAQRLAPSLSEAAFSHAWAGLRPDTPDHLPLIGPLPHLDGVTIAAGHFRNGVLLSPVTGQLVSDWVLERRLPDMLRSFLPERFL